MKNGLFNLRNGYFFTLFFATIIFSNHYVSSQNTYYWVGGTGTKTFNTVGNWNTVVGGGGTSPTALLNTDIFVVDGDDLGGGAQGALGLEMSGHTNIGQFILRDNNQELTLTGVAQYVLHVGSTIDGTDFLVGSGCHLTISTNAAVLLSTTAGLTASIAGTVTVNAYTTLNVMADAGAVTTVTGTIVTHGSVVSSSADRFVFEDGSLFEYARDGYTLPYATWKTGSTCKITGIVNTYPSNNSGTFHHYIWDCPGQLTNSAGAIGNTFVVNGDLTIGNNPASFLELPDYSVTINGNTVVGGNSGGTLKIAAGTANRVFNGNFTIGSGATLNHNTSATLTFNGNFTNNGTMTGPANSLTTYLFKGSGKTIGGSGNLTFRYVQVNSPGTVTLTTDAMVNVILTLTSGTFDIGTKTLTLNNAVNTGLGRIDADAGTLVLNFALAIDHFLLNDVVKNLNLSNSFGQYFTTENLIITGSLNLNNRGLETYGTINMAGNSITKGSGYIDARYGTILFTNSDPLMLPAGVFLGDFIKDLTVNSTKRVTLGSDLTVKGILAFTSDTLDISSYTLTMNGTSVTRSTGRLDADAGTFTLTNSQPITLPANVFAGNVYNLTVNGSGGVTHSSYTSVTGTFSTINGNFVLGNFDLNLGTATNAGGSPTGYVKTTGTGRMLREVAYIGALFPVGRAYYNPVTINNFTGTDDVFSLRVEDAVYVNGLNGSEINTPKVNVTWHIGKGNPTADAGSGVNMAFEWWQPQELLGINDYKLNHHDGTGWKLAETSGTPDMTFSFSGARRYNFPGYRGTFSPFAFGGNISPLPVVLTSFTATCENNRVELVWKTESEINNEWFTVHRSADLKTWEEVLKMPGAGNSNAPLTYIATDERAREGINYYRLTQTDYDGTSETFAPISVFCGYENSAADWMVFPNPSDGQFTVLFAGHELPGETRLELTDLSGRVLKVLPVSPTKGKMEYTADISDLPAGIYMLRMYAKGFVLGTPAKIMLH